MGLLDKLVGAKKKDGKRKAAAEKATAEAPKSVERPAPTAEKDFTMNAKRGPNGKTLVLVLSGRLDALSTADFDESCEKLIKKGEKEFLLEMSGVTFIASAGLRSIMSLSMRLRAVEGVLAFCNLTDSVDSVFQLAGMKKMFPIHATLKEALASM